MENTLITTIKDQVAKDHGYDSWMDFTSHSNLRYSTSRIIINTFAHRISEHCCKEQREQCADALEIPGDYEHGDFYGIHSNIENAPLASDKYKP